MEPEQDRPIEPESRGPHDEFLFAVNTVGQPLDELEAVFEKRVKRCESLGESTSLDRTAYERARTVLREVIGERSSGGEPEAC
jgi:hypothetical protein